MRGNLRHWEALERTDPNHTKPFDRGRFKGTATKPIWNERQLTEHFGPCGIGWGMDKPEFTLVPAADEIAVFCTVRLWYKDEYTTIGQVYGVGGDKVLAQQKNGAFVSDESYKGAFTDALGNAMKHIGVNADIHMGRFEDNKYVRELREQFSPAQANVEVPTRPGAAGDNGRGATRNAPAAAAGIPSAAATPKAQHPKWDYVTARSGEIANALKGAQTPNDASDIWSLNDRDLDLIVQVRPAYYQRLEKLRDEMLAKLRPAPAFPITGSAPELMGEP